MNTTPPLSTEELISTMRQGWEPKWAFFWGHTLSKDGSVTKSCFSQWWAGNAFTLEGITYPTAEHWMMAEKARLFHDRKGLANILTAKSPAVAKKLGRQVAGFEEEIWLRHRWEIVLRGNAAKFGQHPELKQFLLGTGDRILVEASPYDRVWGIGLAATHADAARPENWKGLNLLGFALMEIRRQFQSPLS
ncbi:MAG: hypothetical protein JWM59_584 [Verrucomicrobiales bacterium]|nr:hypothetical protein [Verrucomicrobiales bacterium]